MDITKSVFNIVNNMDLYGEFPVKEINEIEGMNARVVETNALKTEEIVEITMEDFEEEGKENLIFELGTLIGSLRAISAKQRAEAKK